MCGRRKKSLVHTVCACSVHSGFLEILEISVSLSVTLTSVKTCRLFLFERCLALLCVDNNEGAINYPCIRPFQLSAMADLAGRTYTIDRHIGSKGSETQTPAYWSFSVGLDEQ